MTYRFASLSSGLLARKGNAQPAMASHGGGNPRLLRETIQFVTAEAEPNASFEPNAALSRAGFAFEAGPPPFPPAAAPIVARAPATPAPTPATKAPPPEVSAPVVDLEGGCSLAGACATATMADTDPAKRFHVSVRLRQTHFVRLKIASAQLRKPSQEIVAEALTAYFKQLDPGVFGDCACARDSV